MKPKERLRAARYEPGGAAPAPRSPLPRGSHQQQGGVDRLVVGGTLQQRRPGSQQHCQEQAQADNAQHTSDLRPWAPPTRVLRCTAARKRLKLGCGEGGGLKCSVTAGVLRHGLQVLVWSPWGCKAQMHSN